jgi:hypothetical protein
MHVISSRTGRPMRPLTVTIGDGADQVEPMPASLWTSPDRGAAVDDKW